MAHTCRWDDDGFLEIPQGIATSVSGVEDIIVLHRRLAVTELYDEVNEYTRAQVTGPPGCGNQPVCLQEPCQVLVEDNQMCGVAWRFSVCSLYVTQ